MKKWIRSTGARNEEAQARGVGGGGVNIPDRYCSRHGVKMTPGEPRITYDKKSGKPDLIWVTYECPHFWSHFFDSPIFDDKRELFFPSECA